MNNKKENLIEKNIKKQGNNMPDKTLLNLIQNRICKIKCNEGNGFGFFCNINIDKSNSLLIPVLITSRHVLNEDDIKPGKKINFSMNDDETKYEIDIDEERNIYISKKFDITIIEIKNEDKIKYDSFFEINDNIYNPDNNLKNKSIYSLYYFKGKGINFSKGLINNVDENYYEILSNDNDDGFQVGPLIDSINYKVIGIHKSDSKEYNINCGISLKEPIIEFRNQIKILDSKISHNINEITDNIKKKRYI